jgi:hypothetical protein
VASIEEDENDLWYGWYKCAGCGFHFITEMELKEHIKSEQRSEVHRALEIVWNRIKGK